MAVYDPSKKYQWSNEDVFQITGRDLALFLNTFRSILNTEEAVKILLAERCSEVIEKMMEDGVEKDIIKEVTEDNPLRIIK